MSPALPGAPGDRDAARPPLPALGLDVGERRLGVALADASGAWVHAIETIDRRRTPNVFARLAQLLRHHGAVAFVVGLPRHPSGDDSEQTARVRRFAAALRRHFPAPWIGFADERLSTFAAEAELHEAGLPLGGGPGADAHAARHILATALRDGIVELLPPAGSGDGGGADPAPPPPAGPPHG